MDYAETIGAHYIDGNWVEDSDHSQNINPSNTADIIGRFARGDAGRVDQAVTAAADAQPGCCLLYTSPSPRDRTRSRMPSSA